jgi:DNA primase large subunit
MLSERDLARFSFTRQAASLLETLKIKVDELADPSFNAIIKRAKGRIKEAIKNGVVEAELDDPSIELMSFPVAIMLVKALEDRFLYRRYATAESKRASKQLEKETNTRLLLLAKESFRWKLVQNDERDAQRYPFLLYFIEYIRNAASFHEPRWKLVNKPVKDGYVRISKADATRLMEVEVERMISQSLLLEVDMKLPEELKTHLQEIQAVLEENRGKMGSEELPKEIVIEAFPPCIRRAYEGLVTGRKASHMERFALTSFLVNTGMDLDMIVKLFVSVSDFDEGLTRYQVEHIAGQRGGRTRYTSPTCSTLKTHGICINPDSICSGLRHPLVYYRRKLRLLKQQQKSE